MAFTPAVGMVCAEFGIPHLASLFGIADDYKFPGGDLPFKYCDLIYSDSIRYAKKWSSLLKQNWVCARGAVPAELFEIGFDNLYVRPDVTPDKIILGMAGTFTTRKSQLEVIQSLRLLDGAILSRVELHLFGGVDAYPNYGLACREARKEAVESGATVVFHGHLTDIAEIYKRVHIVLSVSSFESFPNSIKEAAAAGCLVIASRAGGIAEMMVDGVNCFLVDGIDPASIAQAITRAISASPDQSLEMRRNAYALAVEEFHPRRALHDLALMYNLCLEAKSGQTAVPALPPLTGAPMLAAEESNIEQPAQPPAGYLSAKYRPAYRIVPQHANWVGLDILIGTHQRPADGQLTVRVLSPKGRVLRQASADLAGARDNDWLAFHFAPIANACGQPFTLEFTLSGAGPQTNVSIYETLPAEGKALRLVRYALGRLGRRQSRKSLHCHLKYA